MSTVFNFLDEIRKRPSMHVGGDDRHRVRQLQALEQILYGYATALKYHGIQEPVMDFGREFSDYLRETRGWSLSCGPTAAIVDATANEQEAWSVFWQLVDEFRESKALSSIEGN